MGTGFLLPKRIFSVCGVVTSGCVGCSAVFSSAFSVVLSAAALAALNNLSKKSHDSFYLYRFIYFYFTTKIRICLPENRFLGLYLTGKTEPCSDIILPNNPTSFLPNICVWISSRRGRLWVLMTYLSCRFFLSNRSCKEGRSSDKHLCLR